MQEVHKELKLTELGPEIQEVTGTVVLAQEGRFRVQLDDGRSILFTLGADAGGSLEELESWANRGRRVHVRFRSRADYAPVAEDVQPI